MDDGLLRFLVGLCNQVERAGLALTLMDAVSALKTSTLFREKMGNEFIDYIVAIKEFEVARFLACVTDWEHREYFEMF
jgi:glutamine synthetase